MTSEDSNGTGTHQNWIANAPADKTPSFMREGIALLAVLAGSIPALYFTLIGKITIPCTLTFIILLALIVYTSFFILTRIGERKLVKYVAFMDNGIMWKTAAGKTGISSYSSVKSIYPTGLGVLFKETKVRPFKENIYTIIFDYKPKIVGDIPENPSFKGAFIRPPRGIVLNRKNTKTLIEKLKKIDHELKNVEIYEALR